MSEPDKEQIEHWLKVARDHIRRSRENIRNGYYERKQIPLQSIYTGVALSHVNIGRTLFLNGDPLDSSRCAFATAARCVLKSFTMAYDPSDPDYQGSQVDWSEVAETYFIDGINYALMSADFELANELAGWWRDTADDDPMDPPINRYVWALKYAVLGDTHKAWNDYLRISMEAYSKKPPKGHNWRSNYFTLSTALAGIVLGDSETLNLGLKIQCDFYAREANGEYKDTSQEFICENAVALANLGLHRGLTITLQHELLPRGLLIDA